jgi:hypothetical protein
MLYVVAAFVGMIYAIMNKGFTLEVASNMFWAILNSVIFSLFIVVAVQRNNYPMEES